MSEGQKAGPPSRAIEDASREEQGLFAVPIDKLCVTSSAGKFE